MTRRLLASVALAAALAACGIVTPQPVEAPEYSCGSVPAGACWEQADGLAPVGRPVRSIELVCPGENCTRAGGAGTATITLADGTTVRRNWSYVGDPGPAPDPTCLGLARDICLEHIADVIDDVSPSHHLTAITVTCKPRCDATVGEVEIVFASEGGLEDTITRTWGEAQP